MTDERAGAATERASSLGARDVAEGRLRALGEIGRAATSTSERSRLRAVLDAARTAAGAASISLGVWLDDVERLKTVMNLGDLADWEVEEPEDELYEADESTWLVAAPTEHVGLVVAVDDPATSPGDVAFLQSLGKSSAMVFPVMRRGAWWGELFFARAAEQPRYTHADLEWGTAVAAQVGAALDLMEHVDRFDQLAHTDELTGLPNRRAVAELVDLAVAALQERAQPVSLVLVDVNGLKLINDEHGHDAGDRALVAFGSLLERVSGRMPGALAARLGGDEFCIVAPGVSSDTVVAAAEEVARLGWDLLPHGVSVGVVSSEDAVGPVEVPGRLFRLADAAQYRAKRMRSRHAVVAGRALPEDAARPLDEPEADRPRDRRMIRGQGDPDEVQLLEAGLRSLDQAQDESVRTRLGLVADLVAHQLDALGWWLSFAHAAAEALTTVEFAVYRSIPGLGPGDLDGEIGACFPLADFPLTRLALDGLAQAVSADDPATDPAERSILDELHATGALAAGGRDDEGDRWLVEVYTDGLSRSVPSVLSVLRLLVLAALHPPARPPAR